MILFRHAVAAALAAALAPAALAQGPCAEDVQRLCQGTAPGSERLACLWPKRDLLTPACQQDLARAEQRAREIHQNCRADVWQFCQGIAPGQGRILACLKSHEAELSPPCAEEFGRAREKVRGIQQACAGDAKQLCAGIKAGRGRLYACLVSNRDRVSPSCQQALAR
ncbi:MAG TPA: cysteine rich repeat-containing protein [Anaeromyxobacteraceae bacterium]|nr:cysteine rich repeat-containing protein [Anaeromyxobacteraceae bacterium]